jgi:cytochrome c oxidase subunit 3
VPSDQPVFRAAAIGKKTVPGATVTEDIELIIDDRGGGGGGKVPPAGGDGGGDGDKHRRPRKPSQRLYSTAIALAMASILMFFLGLCTAFIVLMHVSGVWVPVRLPKILLLNTAILLTSSYTLERARKYLFRGDPLRFEKLWRITTALGILFLLGQLIAWLQLFASGVYIASNQATSFFYIFTAAHAVHLLGGVTALSYVALRNFDQAKISRNTAVKISSYYWHFMDGLWIFLLALLYLGR